jgi:antirestriction protein ArdC
VLSLWCAEQVAGYGDSRWATYKQWGELGAQVRKGERSSLVVFYKDYAVETDQEGDDGRRFVARASFAFNASQVDGAPAVEDLPTGGYYPLPAMDDLAYRTGAIIREGGEQACYVPATDEIRMPLRGRFKDGHGWASTLAHELTHWTGAPPRLARDMSARFKSEAYAAEELVAELGSAFLCAQIGIACDPHPNHASYIASWLRLLRDDNWAIFRAAALASQAVEYLTKEPGAP